MGQWLDKEKVIDKFDTAAETELEKKGLTI